MRKILLGLLLALLTTLACAQEAFQLFPDQRKGFNSYIRNAPKYIDVRVLAANVNETHTTPSANVVLFSSNCAAFYAIIGPTAAVPAADVTDGSGSELNPSAWFVGKAAQIGLISPTACTVTISWYVIQ